MTTLELLQAARRWLIDPDHWGRGAYYLDHTGEACGPWDINLSSTCALGAVYQFADRQITSVQDQHFQAMEALHQALPERWQMAGVMAMNEDAATTHADVLALYDRAILAQTVRHPDYEPAARIEEAEEIVAEAQLAFGINDIVVNPCLRRHSAGVIPSRQCRHSSLIAVLG